MNNVDTMQYLLYLFEQVWTRKEKLRKALSIRNFPGRAFQTKGTFVKAKETSRSYLVILGYIL